MVVCTYEDRPESATGLQLLALSLQRHAPEIPFHVFLGFEDEALLAWLRRRPNVRADVWTDDARGWDAKPTVLLRCLDQSAEEVIWADTDVLVVEDFQPILDGIPAHTFVTAPVRWHMIEHGGSRRRAEGLGLTVGRDSEQANSCFCRATPAHRELLEAWRATLRSSDYRAAQEQPPDRRPLHLFGDQDVLTGLLASVRFKDIPHHVLRLGRDIAHCGHPTHYSVVERLRNLRRGLPPLVHAMGSEPWSEKSYQRARYDLSPYCAAAVPYRNQIRTGQRDDWMLPRTRLHRLQHVLAGGNPNLRDIPKVVQRDLEFCCRQGWQRMRTGFGRMWSRRRRPWRNIGAEAERRP